MRKLIRDYGLQALRALAAPSHFWPGLQASHWGVSHASENGPPPSPGFGWGPPTTLWSPRSPSSERTGES